MTEKNCRECGEHTQHKPYRSNLFSKNLQDLWTPKMVSEGFVEDKIDEKLREAHSEILEKHGVESGDIRPERKVAMDKARDKLVRQTVLWLER